MAPFGVGSSLGMRTSFLLLLCVMGGWVAHGNRVDGLLAWGGKQGVKWDGIAVESLPLLPGQLGVFASADIPAGMVPGEISEVVNHLV